MTVALVLLAGGIAGLWWADQRERELDRQRAQWRARSIRVHAGRCPWSGRLGQVVDGIEWVIQCPRCNEVFASWSDDWPVLPDHADDRSR